MDAENQSETEFTKKKSIHLQHLLLVYLLKLCSNCQYSIGNNVAAHTHIIINLTSKCHKMRSKWYHRLKFSVTICMYCNMSALLDCLLAHFKDSQYRVTVWLMGFRCSLFETLTGCGGMCRGYANVWTQENLFDTRRIGIRCVTHIQSATAIDCY